MIYPDNMPFDQWCANLFIDFPVSFQSIGANENEWQFYAARINQIPQIAVNNPPDPYAYTDWRDWGRRLIELNF